MSSKLFFGDNLTVLREHVPDESVDLVYLDPPFNSQARYNVLFKSPREDIASAQVAAFVDFWSWGEEAEGAYHEIMAAGGSIASLMSSLRQALGESDMMAYFSMMAIRLIELHRVLKKTGSLYLHCDPTASHYLKIILDGVFGNKRYLNEIIWLRANAHNFKTRAWPRQHDTILVYTKGDAFTLNKIYEPYSKEQLSRYKIDDDGRHYTGQDLTVSLVRPRRQFTWRGVTPPPHRSWGASEEQLESWLSEGKILLKRDGAPRMDGLKIYLDETKGKQVGSVWDKISRVKNTASERLGYPTQKPIALLERIVSAGSNKGDVVLDPFCGCGTTSHAAHGLGRIWIGIDISIHAIHVIEQRMADAFGSRSIPKASGIPADFETAARLATSDPFQFQWWANYLVGVHILKEVKKGADRGIDGELFFPNGPGRPYGRMLTSVKAGKNVGPAMVREFRGVLEREKAEMGLFICLDDPTPAMEREAVVAGFAPVVHGRVPRLQIMSMREWFAGRRPQLPPVERLPYAAFSTPKTAKKSKRSDPSAPELPFSFEGGKPKDNVVRHLNPLMVAEHNDDLFSAG